MTQKAPFEIYNVEFSDANATNYSSAPIQLGNIGTEWSFTSGNVIVSGVSYSEGIPTGINVTATEEKGTSNNKIVIGTGEKYIVSYDISVQGTLYKAEGTKIKVSILVGKEYAGKKLIIYHDNGTSVEKYEVVVDSNGYINVEVDNLSPFLVTAYAGDSEIDNTAYVAPQTGDSSMIIALISIVIIASGLILFLKFKKS